MKRFFSFYQYLGPLILTPLAAWLWWRHYNGNFSLAVLALLTPIIHAYVVPAIGTNVFGMWAFNTRLRIGKFRPHHGFVFGSATAMLTLPVMGEPATEVVLSHIVMTAFVVGGTLLAVNWIYDALALRSGFLEVYNQPWAEGAGPWVISADYVFWFFGLFGVIYGAGLRLAEPLLLNNPDFGQTLLFLIALLAATFSLPSLCYVMTSYVRHGHNGLHPVARVVAEGSP